MKPLIIKLTDGSYSDGDTIEWAISDYLEFIQIAKKAGVLDDILKNINFVCKTCNSFIVPTSVLDHVLEKAISFVECDEQYEGWNDHLFWDIRLRLIKDPRLTHEDFKRPLSTVNDEDLEDEEEDFISDEVAIQFDDKCHCNKVMARF